jgi:hypothetical protein
MALNTPSNYFHSGQLPNLIRGVAILCCVLGRNPTRHRRSESSKTTPHLDPEDQAPLTKR